jgi:hypothetical protein
MPLFLSGLGKGFPLSTAVENLISHENESSIEIKIGAPYLSRAGLELLVDPLENCIGWQNAKKSWLIGVHHGITEPAALTDILDLPLSSCRLYTGGKPLHAKALRSRPIFHAKIVGIERRSGKSTQLSGMVVSSANLTGAALYRSTNLDHVVNFEAGASFLVNDQSTNKQWKHWWNSAWGMGIDLKKSNIMSYQDFRHEFIKQNSVIIDLIDPPSQKVVTTARSLWIEAGAMSGGSRNQIEFAEELALFFGPLSKERRYLRIEFDKKNYEKRPLTPKTTTLDVNIWRLSLPIIDSLEFPGRVIKFTKTTTNDTFKIEVANTKSKASENWSVDSNLNGYLGKTGGGRQFGLSP